MKNATMNINTWLTSIAPAGSDNYYALRKIEQRSAIVIILLLFETIMQIPFTLSDDQLVHIKLRWWKEEIIKTQQGKASHPVCIELFSVMKEYQLNYNALLDIINTMESIIKNCQFPTEQSLRDFYTHTYGIRERIISKILSENATQFSDVIHHGAYSLALIDNLKHIRQRALKTYVFFSDEEMQEFGINKNVILTLKTSDELKKLLMRQIEKAEKHFQHLSQNHPQPFLCPLMIRAKLGLKWGELIRDENFPVFTYQLELTPLRKWWLVRGF